MSIHSTKIISRLAAALCISAAAPQAAQAQWIVNDPLNYGNALLREIHQLDQLAAQGRDEIQQLQNYKLQLQNLQQLPGEIREQVRKELERQVLSSVRDFGRSALNKTATLDASSASYYVQAEDILAKNIGDVPRSTSATDADLLALGLPAGRDSGIGRQNYTDRQQYDRVLDDMRQVALTRQNAETRAAQANAIAERMAKLPDNNTVGAIQLLAAQNALSYAQNEDALKAQAIALKNQQEQQVRELVDREELRKLELERLNRVRNRQQVTNVKMVQ